MFDFVSRVLNYDVIADDSKFLVVFNSVKKLDFVDLIWEIAFGTFCVWSEVVINAKVWASAVN